MENITPYNIYEWIALVASIIVGSSAYMFFIAEKKNQHLKINHEQNTLRYLGKPLYNIINKLDPGHFDNLKF